jgi:LmbE family N-acetylglucosaminyl deacetylase
MHFRPRRTGQLLLVALTLSTFHFPLSTFGQRPPAQPSASEILHKMQKLNVLGSVLYIVAHPDDENTRLIAWLANGKKVRTGNLSLTRGDGGQNLIGPELGDALGIIRTQELMEARRIDGGEQFFTRAVDFGYSKNAAESFEKWGKQEVLSDVVRVIRQFRPDIIITRFPPTREAGHGHHEASAMLAAEAFDLAGDPKAFPEQLEQGLEVWQPRRLFFNGSTWWKKDLAEFAKNDPDWFTVDVGGYDPLLGLSYTEIAGRSRSMHKSQGFGAAETRGEMIEYLHFEKGDKPKTKDIFEGIDMTWGRVKQGSEVQNLVNALIGEYEPLDPSSSISALSTLRTKFASLEDSLLRERATSQVELLMFNSIGISAQVKAPREYELVSDSMIATLQLITRAVTPVSVNEYQKDTMLIPNIPYETQMVMYRGQQVDQPYWIQNPHAGLYSLPTFVDPTRPAPSNSFTYATVKVGNDELELRVPLNYKWVDRVEGEKEKPIVPLPYLVGRVQPVLMSRTGKGVVAVTFEANADVPSVFVRTEAPNGWRVEPMGIELKDLKAGQARIQTYSVEQIGSGPSGQLSWSEKRFDDDYDEHVRSRFLYALDSAKGLLYDPGSAKGLWQLLEQHDISYGHLLPQTYFTPTSVKLVPLDVKTTAKTVGYIKGAGDDVPQAIEQLGATVDMIEPSTATLESISKYDAIVVGIRAYNNNHALKQFNPTLMKYVENGGTVVVQYNTKSSDMVLPDSLIGPYPFKLTRDRVTVEEAPPTFLAKDHPLLNTPNTITTADFDGWVQERGLYFVGGFEKHYTPLIAWNDPGEQPLNGGLITCDYGKGRYVYTGISFFRQLPAGVPGAYRLFANLISKRITP